MMLLHIVCHSFPEVGVVLLTHIHIYIYSLAQVLALDPDRETLKAWQDAQSQRD